MTSQAHPPAPGMTQDERTRFRAAEFIHTRLRVKGVTLNGVDMTWQELEDELTDFIRSTSTAPEGWKLVPREPTLEMLQADYAKTYQPGHSAGIWQAMYDAAPLSPEGREG